VPEELDENEIAIVLVTVPAAVVLFPKPRFVLLISSQVPLAPGVDVGVVPETSVHRIHIGVIIPVVNHVPLLVPLWVPVADLVMAPVVLNVMFDTAFTGDVVVET
jgi:hypothetical protein